MSLSTYLYRYVLSKVLTVIYCIMTLCSFLVTYLKNPFSDPWAIKLRLNPPTLLTDPKFGVHKYMKVNNIKIHYVESGDPSKPLMLFLHGFPEFWYSWRHQIVEFNRDYWCVAIDKRGYGDSEKPEKLSAYKSEEVVEDLIDLVRNLGRKKFILVAHDWGSLIACKIRDQYPDLLSGLVICGGTSMEAFLDSLWSDSTQFRKSWYVFMFQSPWLPEMLCQANNMEFLDKALRVGKDTITEQDIECYKFCFGKPAAFTYPVNYYRANFSIYMPSKKPRCELLVPFLAVHGQNDPFLSPCNMDHLKEYYPNIDTVILDNCGHFLQQEEPMKFNKLIREFLSKNKL